MQRCVAQFLLLYDYLCTMQTNEPQNDMKNKENRKGRASNADDVFFPVAESRQCMPDWYGGMLDQIKNFITNERKRVLWEANVMMTMMYYHIGKTILQQSDSEGWGARVIDRLSVDLKSSYPEMKGFSPRNLKYMQRFAKLWPDESIVQRCIARLPWRHIICLMENVQEPNRRLVYAMAAIKNGWSKSVLEFNIDNFTLERTGKLPSNFDKMMPDANSDMVNQMFKDPYLLDFTGADQNSREKDIEDGLTSHITKFLLELGQGFSFVGRQVHLEMAGHDYYIDMLFYHLQLRRFVVVELKAVPFSPEMMGQLAFYQTVVDHAFKHETDEPTIGLLLVKSKSETIVRYSLESVNKPMGVASWETEITTDIADKWKSSLPTIEDIENELNDNDCNGLTDGSSDDSENK